MARRAWSMVMAASDLVRPPPIMSSSSDEEEEELEGLDRVSVSEVDGQHGTKGSAVDGSAGGETGNFRRPSGSNGIRGLPVGGMGEDNSFSPPPRPQSPADIFVPSLRRAQQAEESLAPTFAPPADPNPDPIEEEIKELEGDFSAAATTEREPSPRDVYSSSPLAKGEPPSGQAGGTEQPDQEPQRERTNGEVHGKAGDEKVERRPSRSRKQPQRLDPSPLIGVGFPHNTLSNQRENGQLALAVQSPGSAEAAALAIGRKRRRDDTVGRSKKGGFKGVSSGHVDMAMGVQSSKGKKRATSTSKPPGRGTGTKAGGKANKGKGKPQRQSKKKSSTSASSESSDELSSLNGKLTTESDESGFVSAGPGSSDVDAASSECDDEAELMAAEPYNPIVRIRVARSKMPYRWAEPLPKFSSCLSTPSSAPASLSSPGGGLSADGVLRGALFGDEVADESWLTSTFIDVVMSKFAKHYKGSHFMPIEFAAFRLREMSDQMAMESCTDILGRRIDYAAKRPILFLANIQNLHWNLLRVRHTPVPELELYEPLGKPAKRSKGSHASQGVSYRYIPKEVFHWLDTMYPLKGESWTQRSCSAITQQQQETGFDCGVASLLYAEKCGQEQMREDIDKWTSQHDMTAYRRTLMEFRKVRMISQIGASRFCATWRPVRLLTLSHVPQTMM